MKPLPRIITTIGATLALLLPLAAPAVQSLDGIAAVVNKGVITTSELDNTVKQIRRRMGQHAQGIPADVMRSRVLDHLILQHLERQRAEQAGLTVSDQEVNQALGRLAQQNNLSRADFLAQLKQHGMLHALRKRLHNQLLINKLQRKQVAGHIVITKQDVDRYLQSQSRHVRKNREYHIRHILVSLSTDASSAQIKNARARANRLRQAAISGKQSFADLAVAHSDGQRALKGGDLGWLSGGYLPTLFEDVVPQLKPGEVSQVFRGPSGFHIIKLVGERQAGKKVKNQGPALVKEVHILHILIQPNEIRNNKRSHQLAKQLRERLQAGGNFNDLARKYSDDDSSANQGGDLGWAHLNAFPKAFVQHIQGLHKGQLSQPFHTQAGWHLVKMLGHRTQDESQERRRRQARQAIGQRKLRVQTQIWLHKLRDDAYVDIRIPNYQGTNSKPE